MAGLRSYQICTLFLIFLGTCLSLYAYYVEIVKETNPKYEAWCDFNDLFSCSKVFTSRYGKGFGLLEYVVGEKHWLNQPNSIFGVLFYIIQLILSLNYSLGAVSLAVVLAVVANLGSVYLAYILYFILHDFCVVCVTTYVINLLLLLVVIGRRCLVKSQISRQRTQRVKKKQ